MDDSVQHNPINSPANHLISRQQVVSVWLSRSAPALFIKCQQQWFLKCWINCGVSTSNNVCTYTHCVSVEEAEQHRFIFIGWFYQVHGHSKIMNMSIMTINNSLLVVDFVLQMEVKGTEVVLCRCLWVSLQMFHSVQTAQRLEYSLRRVKLGEKVGAQVKWHVQLGRNAAFNRPEAHLVSLANQLQWD